MAMALPPNPAASQQQEIQQLPRGALARHVIVEPQRELSFRRPFAAVSRRSISIRNGLLDAAVAFKVRTTAPKSYCVRPNAGRLRPGERIDVAVLLQAMREDPPPDFRCRDKFLVLAIRLPPDVAALPDDALRSRIDELFARADELKRSLPDDAAELVLEHKLKCVFLPANPSSLSPAPGPSQSLPAASASNPSITQLQQSQPASSVSSKDSVARTSSTRTEFTDAGESVPTANAASSSASSPTQVLVTRTSTTTAARPDGRKELLDAQEKIRALQAACDAYKAEIERINHLRMRRGPGAASGDADTTTSSSGTSTASSSGAVAAASQLAAARRRQADGVSVPMLIIAIIVAFILGAYLF